MCICYFVIISPWKWAWHLIWTNLFPYQVRLLCAVWINWSSDSAEDDFKILWRYFCYFVIIYPWKCAWPFIWKNLNPLQARMLCSKFGWNWPSGSTEENQISSMYFHYFVIISPWKWGWPFIWTNLNLPLPHDAWCQVWLKLDQRFRKRF